MFNGKITLLIALLAAVLMSGCSLMYYSDLEDDTGGDPTISSGNSSTMTSSFMTSSTMPDKTPTLTEEVDLFSDTAEVSYWTMLTIPSGYTYNSIIKTLGETQAFGYPGYRQYITKDNRVIQLRFESKYDICPYSGSELYDHAQRLEYEYDPYIPEELSGTYGVLAVDGKFVTYIDDSGEITGAELLTDNAEIVFLYDEPAGEEYLIPGKAVIFESDCEYEGNPKQIHCTKITIQENYPDKPWLYDYSYENVESVFANIKTIRYEEIGIIPANVPYRYILERLGNTAAFGFPGYRQYMTDDDRIIPLSFVSLDDLCPYSGEELYERAIPIIYDGEVPEGMTFGVMVGDGSLFTFYQPYEDGIGGSALAYKIDERRHVSDAEIVFEDGTSASRDDLKPETRVFVMSEGEICKKIVILK